MAERRFTHFDYHDKNRRWSFHHRPSPYKRWLVRLLILLVIAVPVVALMRCKSSEQVAQADIADSIFSDSADSLVPHPDDSSINEQEGSSEDSLDSVAASAALDTSAPPNLETSMESMHIARQRDTTLARVIDQNLRRYKPHAAFILMVDASTNEILAWGQRNDSTQAEEPTWLSRSTFPAASLIKIVTSATAMESGRYGISSEFPQIGKSNTLYTKQIQPPENWNGATITLMDAFAKSNNPVMAMVGRSIGGKTLGRIGTRLGFNRQFPGDVPGKSVFLPLDTGYALAEAASGFTRDNTISPLHAAALVRSIIMSADLEMPWSRNISAAWAPQSARPIADTRLSDNTLYGMRELFKRTVSHGTAMKPMRKVVFAQNRKRLEIGGKTGSLDGSDPPGRYDWFAGYAMSDEPGHGVVIVVMQVHDKLRTLPATSMAGLMINHWAKSHLKAP